MFIIKRALRMVSTREARSSVCFVTNVTRTGGRSLCSHPTILPMIGLRAPVTGTKALRVT